MSRKIGKFLGMAMTLDSQLTKKMDFFFKERPFLEENIEPVFVQRTEDEMDAKVDNDIAIEQIVRKIQML